MELETIIRTYKLYTRRHKKKEFDWFRQQSSLKTVIDLATKAKDENGKRYSHQRRIRRTAILEANRILLEKHNALQECKSFHELWLLIKKSLMPIYGIKDLYIYDTALRIGAFLNLFPDRVYLHSGTLKGAKAFGYVKKKKEWLNFDELPKVFSELYAYEIEDLLCIYKNEKVTQTTCFKPATNPPKSVIRSTCI